MALPDPRIIPDPPGIADTKFTLRRYDSVNPVGEDAIQVREELDPRWIVDVRMRKVLISQLPLIEAFWDSLEGGQFLFLVHDVRRSRPIAYMNTALPSTS